jgi:hypothetical protein
MHYSQSTIEPILDQLFPRGHGFFLEIGCWDGELISQTAYLERERGWTGVCVDPFPRSFQNRTCQVVGRAISRDGSPRTFRKVTIDRRYGGDVSYLSGFADRLSPIHLPVIEEFCDYADVQLETITLAQLDAEYHLPAHIDFLSVDTEGSDLEILESLDFQAHSFGAIMFEHNYEDWMRHCAQELLGRHGYQLYKALVIDDIYVRKGNCILDTPKPALAVQLSKENRNELVNKYGFEE